MKNRLTSSYLFISLSCHLLVIFLFALLYDVSVINKDFIVFGAHSSRPSHAKYQQGKPVPFVGGRAGRAAGGRKNSRSSKKTQKKPAKQKKQIKKVSAKKIASKVKDIEVKKEPAKSKKTNKKPKLVKKEEQKEEVLNPKQEPEKEPEKKIEPEKKPEEKLDEKEEQEKEPALLDEGKNPLEDSGAQENNQVGTEEWNDQDTLQFSLSSGSDPEMAKYQECIQHEVVRLWRPPVGVPKNTESRVFFFVNNAGVVEKFEIIKKSDVLIYDLSILRVAKKFLFDKSLWGKKFTIDFRQ